MPNRTRQLSDTPEVTGLTGTERFPIVTHPGAIGGNAYIVAANLAAAVGGQGGVEGPPGATGGIVAAQAGGDLTTVVATPLSMITAPTYMYLANRVYQFVWTDNVVGSVAGDVYSIDIRDGNAGAPSLVQAPYTWTVVAAGAFTPMCCVFEPVTLMGPRQPVAVVTRLSGTGTLRCGSVRLGQLTVADVTRDTRTVLDTRGTELTLVYPEASPININFDFTPNDVSLIELRSAFHAPDSQVSVAAFTFTHPNTTNVKGYIDAATVAAALPPGTWLFNIEQFDSADPEWERELFWGTLTIEAR